MKLTLPLASLAALLLTGCSGAGCPFLDDGSQRRFPTPLRSTAPRTQLIAAVSDPRPEVPGPGALPVVVAAWWWARRLRKEASR